MCSKESESVAKLASVTTKVMSGGGGGFASLSTALFAYNYKQKCQKLRCEKVTKFKEYLCSKKKLIITSEREKKGGHGSGNLAAHKCVQSVNSRWTLLSQWSFTSQSPVSQCSRSMTSLDS